MKRLSITALLFPCVLSANTIDGGDCGKGVSWSFSSDSVLIISGTGAMDDYTSRMDVPWYGDYAKKIRKIVVEDGVSHLGKYAFASCDAKNVELGDGLKSIGNYAFRYCHNVQYLTLPPSLETIGKYAFDQTNIDVVIVEGTTPPTLGAKAFVTSSDLSTDIAGTTTTVNDLGFPFFSVPCGVADVYKSVWTDYANGVYCADSIAKEYDGLGNYRYRLFPGNNYTPTGNSLLITNRDDVEGDNVVVSDGDKYSCKSLTLTDAAAFYAPFDFDVDYFTFNRSGSLGSLVSFYLPVEMPTDYVNGNVYVFDDFDGEFLNFSTYEGDFLEANYPYVVKPDVEETVLIAENVPHCKLKLAEGTTVTKGHLSFFGVSSYSSFVSDEKNHYIVFSAGKVKKYNKINLSAFRAAFHLVEPTYAALGLRFDGDLTGVAVVENDLLIDSPVNVYDVQGRVVRSQVAPATCFMGLPPGVYIVNGQKFYLSGTETPTLKHTRQLKCQTTTERDGVGE